MNDLSIKDLLILVFVGVLFYVFARHRNVNITAGIGGVKNYPAATDSVDGESLMLSLGFVHGVDANAADCVIPSSMESRTCGIPLASDYLHRSFAYTPAVSQWNIGGSCEQASCFSIEKVDNTSTRVPKKDKILAQRPLQNLGDITCHPDIPVCIPNTETI